MSIELQKISFRNFMSFGNDTTEISLSTQGTTHIMGKNLDKGGSSGSGKTSIINAICYALYDKTPSNIGKERLINTTNNAKNTLMEVILEFKKDDVDEYKIRRTRGETSSITIFKNEKDITPDSVVNTNRFIEELVGISYELFNRVVLFSGNARPFLDLPVHEQRQLIEELLKITMLSTKAIVLKEDIKTCEKDIEISKIQIKQQEAQNDLHCKHVKESEVRLTRWEEQHAKDIDTLQKQLATISNINWEDEEKNHQLANTLRESIRQLVLEINPRVSEKSQLEKEIARLKKELSHLENDKCPYCLQKYADATTKRTLISDDIGTTSSALEIITREISEFETEMKQHKTDLALIEGMLKHGDLSAALKLRSNVDNLNNNLTRLENEENPHIEAYESLLAEKEIKIEF